MLNFSPLGYMSQLEYLPTYLTIYLSVLFIIVLANMTYV